MNANDRTWLTYMVAFAVPLCALALALVRQFRERRRLR